MSRNRRARGAVRPSGILVIDKPPEMTSFSVVHRVRRILGVAKAGHTGTLDPLATGVLPICLNEATKVAGLLLAEDKIYLAEVELGLRTDTFDRQGTELAHWAGVLPTRSEVEAALAPLRGAISQRPPSFSAVHHEGKRAYELARKGVVVELPPRDVEVFSLDLSSWDPPRIELRVHCSKGTYIRSLVNDLGLSLGCGAVLTELRRTQSGSYTLDQAVSLDSLEQEPEGAPLIALGVALEHLPALSVNDDEARRIAMGQSVDVDAADAASAVVSFGGEVFALAHVSDGQLHPDRVMPTILDDLLTLKLD